jgi:DGQHR domain-containing protein
MTNAVIKFKLIKVRNILDIDFYTGTISLNDIKEIGEVPVYKKWKPLQNGYQRNESQKRIDQIRDKALKNPDNLDTLVDAVNLNIRVKDASTHIEPLDKSETDYGDFFTFKYIDAYGKAYIVDGQHRIKGVLAALEKAKQDGDEETVKKLENGKINISLTLTDDVYKEAYVFYLINKYAKAVAPDGAFRLIVEGHKAGDLNFYNEVISGASMDLDDISSASVADALAAKSNVWSTRVKDFNDTGAGKVSVRALSLMIRPLFLAVKSTLKTSGTRINPEQKTYDIIEAYWNALESIFNKTIFDPLKTKEYGLMKSSQSEVMFKVLTFIFKVHIEDWDKKFGVKPFGNLADEKTWVKIMKKALENFKDQNASGYTLTGHECWYVGKAGSMGLYTSSAAKRDIAQKLVKEIETSHGIQRSQVV